MNNIPIALVVLTSLLTVYVVAATWRPRKPGPRPLKGPRRWKQSTDDEQNTMDALFILIIIGLYAAMHWVVTSALQRGLVIRYQSQPAQQRGNRQPLCEYGESHDRKRKTDDGIAIRQV
jgi:hypothetical protein